MELPEEKVNKAVDKKPGKMSLWIKIPLRVIACVVIIVLLIPVALYIPPVQRTVKDLTCKIVRDKTGMDVKIDRFLLKFPIDIDLKGVSVVEASGDTMVRARDAIVGVRLLPLLGLKVEVKKLKLVDGYYRMVSPDSSMIMKIRAGLLQIESEADVNIRTSDIQLGRTLLENGDVSLYMNVWKQQPTPTDTTSTPLLIKSEDLKIRNIRFAMSMLPTIDTLVVNAGNLDLKDGIIDLRTNSVTARRMDLNGGNVRYIAPTPEYIAAHPVPAADTISSSPPMIIRAGEINVSDLAAVYAVKDAVPQPGFDPNYIEVKNVFINLRDFYNEAVNLKLPIEHLSAEERSGLRIVEGNGTVALNEAGIKLDQLSVETPYSRISANADLPFALMELQPDAPVNAFLDASVGMPDIQCFMPSLAPFVRSLEGRSLNALIEANGALDNVAVERLGIGIPGVMEISGEGYARNALDLKRMVADVEFRGNISNPAPLQKIAGSSLPVEIPVLTIKGRATANNQNYMVDFDLRTSRGDVVGLGHVGMTSERYDADLNINHLDIGHFMPDSGIGMLTASLKASGAGFDPTSGGASGSVEGMIKSIAYNGNILKDISLEATLTKSDFTLDLDSPNPDLNITGHLIGSLKPDDYCAEGIIKLYNADLRKLGFMETECRGAADLHLDVSARPDRWLYDAVMDFRSIDWHLQDADIYIPDGISVDFISEPESVNCNITADGTEINLASSQGLKSFIDAFMLGMDTAMRQIKEQNLDVEEMGNLLPDFDLKARIKGSGMLNEIIASSGMAIDTLSLNLRNDSLINGNLYLGSLNTGSMTLDTITLNLKERNKMLDYKIHMGNRPGVLDEFAQVNLNGYVGSNRISAYLTQKNLAGKTGYKFGFTGSIADSTVSLHFTPLRATIAYLPWTFNDDNHVDYNLSNRRMNAKIKASSRESSLLLMTENGPLGEDELHLNLSNIHIQDFLNMSLMAPPVQGDVNADVRINYNGTTLNGNGDISIGNLIYDRMRIGDLDMGLNAGVDLNGKTLASAALKINKHPALTISSELESTPSGLEPRRVDLELTRFPLNIANPFLGKDVASLSGVLNGKMNMTGKLTQPILNGGINCDSVAVYLPIMGSSLKFGQDSLAVENSVLKFNNFDIYGANNNPISINGLIDARKFSDMKFDLRVRASEFQLINNDRRAKSDLYGKLFLNLTADVKGPMKRFDINANVGVLGNTDVYYTIPMGSQQLSNITSAEDVVRFVNFADTVSVTQKNEDMQTMVMRIGAGLTITPGAQVTVNLSTNGTDKVQLSPSGTLNFFQNYMGDMTLNGQLFLGNGMARYNIPVLGDKTFTFDPQSYVAFNGDIMNPTLNIHATDEVKATVVNSSGNSNQANFIVGLNITNNLSAPKVVFDLSTNDDLSLQNELQSMSADQRSAQAMNLLITGRYQGTGMKTTSGPIAENMLYGFLTSTLNQWAAKNIRGVDLSFGVDQYNNTTDGQTSTSTSYSYQVSKTLFSNRFKIVVGGNYSTDASVDENFSQNLISDISFEYTLKQTNNLTMLVRLFRHVGYESILEGEVTEMGVGFTMRRRLSNLKNLFRVRWKRRKPSLLPVATVPGVQESADLPERIDSVMSQERKEVEK